MIDKAFCSEIQIGRKYNQNNFSSFFLINLSRIANLMIVRVLHSRPLPTTSRTSAASSLTRILLYHHLQPLHHLNRLHLILFHHLHPLPIYIDNFHCCLFIFLNLFFESEISADFCRLIPNTPAYKR